MDNKDLIELVKRFLRSMEARELEAAETMIAPGAKITFPGGKEYASQREMVENSRGRYQWVKKNFDQFDVLKTEDADTVYVLGTLYGVNRNEVPFSEVRFIDRFEVKSGLITRQDVWNDLAESGVLEIENQQ